MRFIKKSWICESYTIIRRHPRTAIGTDRKGNVYLIVVDGRSKGNAEGLTIAELTKVCEWIGLRDAINLDGVNPSIVNSLAQTAAHLTETEKVYAKAIEEGVKRVKTGNVIGIAELQHHNL